MTRGSKSQANPCTRLSVPGARSGRLRGAPAPPASATPPIALRAPPSNRKLSALDPAGHERSRPRGGLRAPFAEVRARSTHKRRLGPQSRRYYFPLCLRLRLAAPPAPPQQRPPGGDCRSRRGTDHSVGCIRSSCRTRRSPVCQISVGAGIPQGMGSPNPSKPIASERA